MNLSLLSEPAADALTLASVLPEILINRQPQDNALFTDIPESNDISEATDISEANDVPEANLRASLRAQEHWAATPVRTRLQVLRRARHVLAERVEELAEAISPALQRSRADTLVAEVLPLLDACRFLEREAERLLRPRKLGRRGRPFWLTGVQAEVQRVPLGRVLIIGPGNFPLFLPGVQALQALTAGNAVVWKPGEGGEPVARLVAKALADAGLPADTLQVTGEAVEFATGMIATGPNKVVFTGGSRTGRNVLQQLASRLIPATLELSGVDAIIVLESADLPRVAKAVSFAMRLNGGAVCMSPRRLLGSADTLRQLAPLLVREFQSLPSVRLGKAVATRVETSLATARLEGGDVLGDLCPEAQRPLLVQNAHPGMHLTREAYFVPILAMMQAGSDADLALLHNANPYGLTASIFGNETDALEVASKLSTGSVLINDVIAPTADPRLPFGGRGESGYGVTRGAEGLLEMTAVKVIQRRTNTSTRHYEATHDADVPFFAGLIRMTHAERWSARVRALSVVAKTAPKHK